MEYRTDIDEKWKCTIEIDLDREEFNDVYSSVLKAFKQEADIKGFRKGKAPVSIIKKRYGSEIENETINRIIPEKYSEIINEEKIQPITQPLVTNMKKDEEKIAIEMIIDTYPDVTIDNYKDIEIEIEKQTVNDEMVMEEIDRLRKNHADMEEIDRELEKDDVAIIDLKVFDSEDNEMEELETKDYSLEIGSAKVYPEISDSVTGKKPGESIEVKYTYPEDFEDDKLKGKDVVFHIDIKKGFKRNLPEMDEDFAKNFGMNNMEQVKEAVKNSLQNKFDKDYEAQKEEKVMNKIIEDNPFEVPESLVSAHLKSLVNNMSRGQEPEITDQIKQVYGPYAEWRAKREIILSSIIDQENIEVDQKDISEEIDKFRNHPNEQMREYADSDSIENDIKTDMLYNNAREFLFKNVTVTGEETEEQSADNEKDKEDDKQSDKGEE